MINRKTSRSTSAGIWEYVAQVKPEIESALLQHLPVSLLPSQSGFDEALHYAMFPGGKRLRPALTMLAAEAVGGCRSDVLRAAVAVEYLHNSSLIFDDLPCMDNAVERRGKPTLHQRYGEGLAVLVAIALLNASYRLFVNCEDTKSAATLLALGEIVNCIEGQIRGQTLDIAQSASNIVLAELETVRNLKATALIRLALRLGPILTGTDQHHLEVLSAFADLLGEAYQLSDDITDVLEDRTMMEDRRPTTFAVAFGGENAQKRV